jgi:toxin ParE1/3/4
MGVFSVAVSAAAEDDLNDIVNYLCGFSYEIASRYYAEIKEKLLSLRAMPERCPLVHDEEFSSKGYRWLFVRNYTVFFTVDTQNAMVVVRRILYSYRDYTALL